MAGRFADSLGFEVWLKEIVEDLEAGRCQNALKHLAALQQDIERELGRYADLSAPKDIRDLKTNVNQLALALRLDNLDRASAFAEKALRDLRTR